MNASTMRAAAACALLATTCLVSPALAQTANAQPPRFQNVDDNGVYLVSGTFTFPVVEGSIGSGEGAVGLIRGLGADQWGGVAYRRTSGGVAQMVVERGSVSDTFAISGTSYTATKGDGATLASVGNGYRYTAADGTQVNYISSTFDGSHDYPVQGWQCQLADLGTCAIPVSIRKPNGMTFTITWTFVEKCDYGPEQVIPIDYDALGRKVAETGPLGTMASAYDAAGRGSADVAGRVLRYL